MLELSSYSCLKEENDSDVSSLRQMLQRKHSPKQKIQINNRETWYELGGPEAVLVAHSDGFQPALQGKCFVRKNHIAQSSN